MRAADPFRRLRRAPGRPPRGRAHRWTEIDVARVIVASEDLPKCADGSTPHRVPLFVYKHVPGWRKNKYYTEYPAVAPFVDLARGWVPGSPARTPAEPSVLPHSRSLGLRWVERLAIDGRGQGVSLWHPAAREASRPAGAWRAHKHAGGQGGLVFRRRLATDHVAPSRLVRARARPSRAGSTHCPDAGWSYIASSGGSAT